MPDDPEAAPHFQSRESLGSATILNYQVSNQLHNPTHARVVHLEMLGQLRHGVASGGKGGMNCGVAAVGVLALKASSAIGCGLRWAFGISRREPLMLAPGPVGFCAASKLILLMNFSSPRWFPSCNGLAQTR